MVRQFSPVHSPYTHVFVSLFKDASASDTFHRAQVFHVRNMLGPWIYAILLWSRCMNFLGLSGRLHNE